MSSGPRVTVFLCGEPLRGDDGVAVLAGRGLPPETREAASVREVRGLSPSDLVELPSGSACIVVDAVRGVPAGRLVMRSLDGLDPATLPAAVSSHQVPLPDVLGIAARLGWVADGTFLGVGGERFGLGDNPSEAVVAAAPRLRAAIVLEVARLAVAGAPASERA
jgi:hydrogenase maturation protease